jgi:RNA polymerase sigma-70 factor (ECF subfamily)
MSLETDLDAVVESTNFGAIVDAMQAEDLMKLIAELPVGYGTVFNLYAIEGYNHAEIAEMLDINENTSKSQLSRARKWLQKRLTEIESELEKEFNNGSAKN